MQADPVDPTIVRPRTFQEAKGHAFKALPPSWQNFAGGDGVIYFPGGIGEVPGSGNARNVQYELIDLFAPNGLWERQLHLQEVNGEGQMFATWGTLQGDEGGGCGDGLTTCSEDSASLPWGWDDEDDGPTYRPVHRGEMAMDPALLVDYYFNGLGTFSSHYLRNHYLKRLQDLRSEHGAAWVPTGWPGQLDLGTLVSKLSTSCAYDPPPPPPADPLPWCESGEKCCEPAPEGGCSLCVPRRAQCH
jgi:hypothetical protein